MSRANNTTQERIAMIDRLEASGLSVAEFARAEGIAVRTVYNWRHRLSDKSGMAKETPGHFFEVQSPIVADSRSDDIELEFSDGTKLRMAKLDAASLRGLMQELRSC